MSVMAFRMKSSCASYWRAFRYEMDGWLGNATCGWTLIIQLIKDLV